MDKPMCSVIMSVYNEPIAYIRKSVESIIQQTYRNFEFIIILDKPDDEKKSILREYSDLDSRIRLHFNEQNIGLTSCLNYGLSIARGKYIVRMDADDYSEIHRIEHQIQYIEKSNLDLVGASMRRIDEEGKVVNKYTNKSYPPKCISMLLRYDDCVPHPTWLIKRSVYKKLNGYRDFFACEDYDFLLRMLKLGMRIGICDEILLNYRVNLNGISRSNSLRQMLTADYLQRNFYRIDDVTKEEIVRYIGLKVNDNNAVKYEKAVSVMGRALEALKNRSYLGGVGLLVAPLYSRYIFINYQKIIKMYKIRKYIGV